MSTVTGAVRRRLLAGNGVIVVFGLALLAAAVSLYLIDPLAYLRIMRIWVPETLPVPFADASYIMGQLACWRAGVDVYVANPCDPYGRTLAYPPLWLRLWFLPSDQRAAVPFAFAAVIGFILSLATLPRLSRTRDVALLLAAVASSATVYGVERGNADLLIFVLTAGVAVCIGGTAPLRAIGYAIATLAALLKLYPIVLLAAIVRERRRNVWVMGLVALAILVSLGLLWHDEWFGMLKNVPGPEYSSDGPGGRKLPEGIFIAADWIGMHAGLSGSHLDAVVPRRAWIAGLFAAMLLGAVFSALRLARDTGFTEATDRLDARERACLTVGALTFCGCFMAGTSIAYREVFLLFVLPALLRFSRDAGLSRAVRWTPWMIVPLMWASFPALVFDVAFGKLDEYGGPLPTFGFWLLRELTWWWLFVVLTSALLCLAGLLGVIRIRAERP